MRDILNIVEQALENNESARAIEKKVEDKLCQHMDGVSPQGLQAVLTEIKNQNYESFNCNDKKCTYGKRRVESSDTDSS